MKRSKKLPTRKRQALRRLALLAVLAVLLSALHLYNFLPSQALYELEERANTGRTGVVMRQWAAPNTGLELLPRLMLLSEKDGVNLLTVMRFSLLLGWTPDTYAAEDCDPEARLWGGLCEADLLGTENRVGVFLRIMDPKITTVEIKVKDQTDVVEMTLQTEAASWTEMDDGTRYWCAAVWIPAGNIHTVMTATGYDADGSVAAEFDSYEP